MDDKNIINFDQCVHGYDHGHKMLSSSLQLPKETLNMLLKMSDASISGFSASSSPYITGYPLNEIGAYALSKTWPAPELERPGCVWTQTIIIDYSDLAQIMNLSLLLDLFEKPSRNSLNNFSRSIIFDNTKTCIKNNLNVKEELVAILSSIYKHPTENVILPKVSHADMIIMMIWSQQWPKLRRSFSFRTLVPVSSNSYSFDIGFNNLNKFHFLDSSELSKWVISATEDLYEQNTDLKKFLWFYGPYCSKPKESYPLLVNLHNSLNNDNEEEGLSDAIHLVLNWKEVPSKLLFKVVSKSLFFLEKNYSSALFFSVSNVMSKLRFNGENSSSLLDIFIGIMKRQNPKVILSFIEVCNSDFLINQLYRDMSLSKLISIFNKVDHDKVVEVRPDILLTKDYWNTSKVIHNSVYSIIDKDKSSLKSLVNAVAGSKNFNHIDSFISTGGAKVAAVLLESMSDSYRDDNLINIIVNHKEYLQKSFYDLNNISLDLLCSLCVRVNKEYFNYSEVEDDWAYAVSKSKDKINTSQFDLSIFLFKRAFSKGTPETEKLIRLSLDQVIDSLMKDNMTYKQWQDLLEVIPKMKWWEWDKCEHVLNSVINLLLDKRIYLNHNTNITSSFELKERVMKIYKSR